jgi:Na+/melibiose symporter-like transporter
LSAYGLLLTALVSVNCSVLYPLMRKKCSTRSLYLCAETAMASVCMLFFLVLDETWLLVLVAVFGCVMQVHMQASHELTHNELQPMFERMQNGKEERSGLLVYVMELANVIAPVMVSLFAGPVVEMFEGEFKYLFLMAGCIQLVFCALVGLMFAGVFPWKLPRVLVV